MKLSKIVRCGAAALSLFTVNALAGPYVSTTTCGGITGTLTIDFSDGSDIPPILCTGGAFVYTGVVDVNSPNSFDFRATFAGDFSGITLAMSTGLTTGVGADAIWSFTHPTGSFDSVSEISDDFAAVSNGGADGTVAAGGSRFAVTDTEYGLDKEFQAIYSLRTTGIGPGPDLPEPMSLALVGIALGALGVTRRKAARV